MNIRCPFCRTSFNLSRDVVGRAVLEATEKRQKHYGVECIKCRKIIKVSVSQLKRFAPRPIEAEEIESE